MIKLTKKIEQDFLSPEFISKFKEVNVPMDDAKYHLLLIDGTWYVCPIDDIIIISHRHSVDQDLPTYTLSELLYKLPEWHPKLKGLTFGKDAPFYWFNYTEAEDKSPFSCMSEYPIEAAAWLLINCMKQGLGCVGNVSDK